MSFSHASQGDALVIHGTYLGILTYRVPRGTQHVKLLRQLLSKRSHPHRDKYKLKRHLTMPTGPFLLPATCILQVKEGEMRLH